jgi:uncharacterized protein
MAKRPIVLFAAIFLLVAGMLPAHASGDAAAARVDDLFNALRDQNFTKAAANFDPAMKKALSADQLQAVWIQIDTTEGKLLTWHVLSRGQLAGTDVFNLAVVFEHGKLTSTVAVRPQTAQIAGLFFKPMTTEAPSSAAATSPPYADASKFRSEAVTVGEDPWKLPGTLTIPLGKGPFPGAVLLAGSGPQDRDETIGPNHVFKDLAEGLSSRGIVVLRYDKRTYAYKTLDPQKTTVDEEVIEDGVAAVKLLRARREVARDRIFVLGHSLGASMAPEVAKRAGQVAGIVMLAPNGRKMPDVIVQQVQYLGQDSPDDLANLKRQAAKLSAHKMPPTQYFFGAPASYYYDLDERNELAIARSLDVPILILRGSRDYQVIDQDIRYWQTGLAPKANVKVDTLLGLNHLFIAGTGKPGPAEYNTPGHIDVAVIGTIASFMENSASASTSRAAVN